MKVLTFDQVAELKKLLAEKSTGKIHMHDTCGGQYFSIEGETEQTKPLIAEYAAAAGYSAVFDELSHGFTLR